MNANDKIKLGTNLLKAVVAGLAKNKASRTTSGAGKQNSNVSECCTRSSHK